MQALTLDHVGLYLPAATPLDLSLLNDLVSLGISHLFAERGVDLTGFASSKITRCIGHDTVRPDDAPCAIISEVSPRGAIFAAQHGLPIASRAATTPGGFNALATTWELYERYANRAGFEARRGNWSLVVPMHLAETHEAARSEVAANLTRWLARHPSLATLLPGFSDPAEALISRGFAIIGTQEDAIAQVSRLTDATGGFGQFLLLYQDWATPQATARSIELCLDSLAAAPRWYP